MQNRKKILFGFFILTLSVALLFSANYPCADDAFAAKTKIIRQLRDDGGESNGHFDGTKGESTDERHKKWIDVEEWSQGNGQQNHNANGGTGNAGHPRGSHPQPPPRK